LAGDEPVLIHEMSGVNVVVNKNRPKAAAYLFDKCQVDLVISDDGLQHYALSRQVEICVFNGVGNGFLLPAGMLREGASRLKTVDFILTPNAKPKVFVNAVTLEEQPLDYFKNKTCHAVAGIGIPQKFFDSLSALQVICLTHSFADHHLFVRQNLVFGDEKPLIMTAKDWVKCRSFATKNMWFLQIEETLDTDFLQKLDSVL
jgi:tetraacyldisaccharide 4'-kinase